MKNLIVSCTVVLLLALGAGQAFARTSHSTKAPTKVTVVMRDPGCHWFSAGGSLRTKLAVAGPVKLTNFDEAGLLVAGGGFTRHDAVGKSLVLGKGTYTITMVKQAPHDNHLKLIVR